MRNLFLMNLALCLLILTFFNCSEDALPVTGIEKTTFAAAAGVDLVITSATITSRTDSRINYSFTIRNNGTITIPDIYNVVIQGMLSSNTVFGDANDIFAGGSILGVSQSLAAGQSYTGTWYTTTTVPVGMNYLALKIDYSNSIAELNENNNTAVKPINPDLIITSATITSRTDSRINYSFTIKNNGTIAIPNISNVVIQGMLSSNTVFGDANDIYASGSILGANQSLAAGQSYTGTWYTTTAVPAGMNYLAIKIDYSNSIAEMNESNNTVAMPINPDLIITSATITSRTDSRINYSFTIKNNGTIAIPNIYNVVIQGMLSSNTVFGDANDIYAGGSILGVNQSLAAGQSYTGTWYTTTTVPVGMNYLALKIDYSNSIAEMNENNNTAVKPINPDLIITSATITSRTDSRINYSFTIKNNGTIAIPNIYNVVIQGMLSSNTAFGDANDIFAGGSILGVNQSLAAGQSYTGTWYTTTTVPAGMNYLAIKIDYSNSIAEMNESNNTVAMAINPDLIITSATITSRTDSRINYSFTIKNNGTIAIPNIYNVVIQGMLSSNTVFGDAGDIYAGGSILGVSQSLAAGQSYTGTWYTTTTVPTGMSYLALKIDFSDSIAEMNENNNTKVILLPKDSSLSSSM